MLLKCTSTYPAAASDTHLLTIPHMRGAVWLRGGLSDHTFGIGAGVASVALGATVIEKHFTLARADGGVDSTFSMEPAEMAALVVETERAWMALGQVHYGLTEKEQKSQVFRRSLYVAEDLAAGRRPDGKQFENRPSGPGPAPEILREPDRHAGRPCRAPRHADELGTLDADRQPCGAVAAGIAEGR